MDKKIELSEHEIQKEILETLQGIGVYCWRSNVGRKHNMVFGKKGSADITGIIKGGIRLEIEVKDAKGKVSEEQQEFLDTIKKFGGIALVARGLDDVIFNLSNYFL